MSFHRSNRKFHRVSGTRKGMEKTMLVSLIRHGKITTTLAKAKSLRPQVEKLITRARVDSVANRRLIAARLGNNALATKKLFVDVAPKYKGRAGGYTRITKFPARNAKNDARELAVIEFV